MPVVENKLVTALLASDHPMEKTLGSIFALIDNMLDEDIIDKAPELIVIGWHEVKGMAVVPLGMETGTDAVAALASAYLALGEMNGLDLDALIGALRAVAQPQGMGRVGQRPHQRPRGARGRGKRAR